MVTKSVHPLEINATLTREETNDITPLTDLISNEIVRPANKPLSSDNITKKTMPLNSNKYSVLIYIMGGLAVAILASSTFSDLLSLDKSQTETETYSVKIFDSASIKAVFQSDSGEFNWAKFETASGDKIEMLVDKNQLDFLRKHKGVMLKVFYDNVLANLNTDRQETQMEKIKIYRRSITVGDTSGKIDLDDFIVAFMLDPKKSTRLEYDV